MAEEKKIITKPYGEKDKGPHNLVDYDETKKSFSWDSVKENFSWHTSGKVNMAYECIDKHCENGKGSKTAMIYDEDVRGVEKYTYEDMRKLTNQYANVLKKYGIGKGDRVFTFMPRSPECYVAILGILKAGAIPAPLFEAFMEGAVKDRIDDAEGAMVVTTPELRGRIPVKDLPSLKLIMYATAEKDPEKEKSNLDSSNPESVKVISYHAEMAGASDSFDIEWLGLEDPLILHYTSGSTGKPKGVVHVQNAMIGHYQTGKWVLDMQEDDVYWCTADPGWVTGTSYGIFSPYLNCSTNVIKGGRFSVDSWYKCLQDHKVTIWYSAPTAFRLLMAKGEGKEKEYDLSSVRHILSVGEPLNPEVIHWGLEHYGLPIHDTWWMTETGHQLICNYPTMAIKPGSMGKPIPGTEAGIVDDDGKEVPPLTMGNLVIKKGWPGMMRQIWKNPEKYQSYFEFEPWYMSGDSAYMDEEGYFFFEGRIDDVIKTSGERVGPFEVESALVEHPAVSEAGVIGKPDPIRGHIIKAFISLNDGYTDSPELQKEIMDFVKMNLAAHAKPREIEVLPKLPKTRSGKIMRRVLKAKELGLPVGDLSTMEDD
jgi:acetyl-CoA synthetase